jgi:hypothetical protein
MKKMIQAQSASTKQLRTFAIVLIALLSIFGLINFFKGNLPITIWLWSLASAILLMALLLPSSIKPIYQAAFFIAQILGWINTRLILGLIFYLIFAPIAILFKMIKKDPLDRKIDRQAKSYWISRDNEVVNQEQYLKQF